MVVLREELDVDVPVEESFAFVGDFANAQAWDPGVESCGTRRDARRGRDPHDLIVIFGDGGCR